MRLFLGYRPEGVEVNGINNHGSVSGLIYATEPQGSDLFLDISFGESDAPEQALFKVRTQPDVKLRAGDRVSLDVSNGKALPIRQLWSAHLSVE